MNMNQLLVTSKTQAQSRAHNMCTSRRGSALLIVIGTLALISIFAVIYISIGRTDRRAATAVRTQRDQADSSQAIGDYLSAVVGSDRLDVNVQVDGNNQYFGRREVVDLPYTDWTKRSAVATGLEYQLFTPVGGPLSLVGFSAANDNSVASDPWLASTTPVYLGNPGALSMDRPFSTYEAFDPMYPNAKNFLDNRDWLQISNFAPDGRFVNLFSLRPNNAFNTNTIGSFDAEPGTGTVSVDGRQVRRMSENLSLWVKEDPSSSESLIQTFVPGDNGNAVWIPGQNAPINIGLTDVGNIPAVWTMYQRFMYMPINQPFITLNRNGVESSWADPDYPAYQYADTTGDGFADARWFELTSARDSSHDTSTNPRDDVEVLYNNQDYRYFVAVRGFDLSSIVNVNTATDSLVPPTVDYPQGITPADVDLRRLLTMQDPASDYTSWRNSKPLSLAQLHRPFIHDLENEPQWGQWDTPRPQRAFVRNATDYWMYQQDFTGATSDLRLLESNTPSMLIGRYAYSALRRGVLEGSSLTQRYAGSSTGAAFPTGTGLVSLDQFEADPTVPGAQITPEKRFDQFMNVARLNPTNLGTSWARAADFGSGGLYGLDDLTELLTYHGLNDPESTSRLEQVMNGRYQSNNGDELQARRYSPLMSNRPLSLDRDQHGVAMQNIIDNPNIRPGSAESGYREINGRISFNSLAMTAMSPRNKMTTLSGSVSLIPSQRLADASIPVAFDEQTAAVDLKTMLGSPSLLFDLYAGALVGELDVDHDPSVWPTNIGQFGNHLRSTLFYGHRGPELALRIAAHTAVNMKDLADSDGNPSVATLILDNGVNGTAVRDYFTDSPALDPNDDEYQLYPGAASGNLFDLDPRLTPPADRQLANGLDTNRQVVNVYGFEAMPVITEVSVLYAYTDAPRKNGGRGDNDSGGDGAQPSFGIDVGGGPAVIILPEFGTTSEITINGTQAQDNDDYLIQVLAFQLHNPYGHDISLGGTGISHNAPLTRQRKFDDEDSINVDSNYQFDYYIEYAGRFYKIANYLEWYPTVQNAAAENYFDGDDAVYPTVGNPSKPIASITRALGGIMSPGGETSAAVTVGTYGNVSQYSDFISRNVVLPAGETRVFYVISDKRFDDATPETNDDGMNPDDRWVRSLKGYDSLPNKFENLDADGDNYADGRDGKGWTGPAEEWVQHQFRMRSGQRPIKMMEFHPEDGQNLNETLFGDPTVSNPDRLYMNRDDITEVRLWKKVTTLEEEADETDTGLDNPTYRNLIENDLLVDRMDISTPLTLAFNGGEISDTISYREGFGITPPAPAGINVNNIRNDNKGITIAQWSTIRRRDSETEDKPSIGEITPWMLHSRSNPLLTQIGHDLEAHLAIQALSADTLFVDIGGPGALNDPETIVAMKPDFETQQTLLAFFNMARSTGQEIIQTAVLSPHLKSAVVAQGGGPQVVEDDAGNRSTDKFPKTPLGLSGTALDLTNKAAPEIFVSGDNIADKPRLADLLLAWGIGPTYAPDPGRATGLAEYHADEWMTGPEAMAIALGVEDPPISTDADGVWNKAYGQSGTKPLLDDGHLVIDDFVPYLNVNIETPAEFNPGIGGDIARGLGVPVALGVIDHARAIAPLTQITDPNTLTPTPEQRLELALTRATYGSININTAPIEVLRLLPGLTPSRGEYQGPGGVGAVFDWIGREPTLSDLNLPSLDVTNLEENPDVAAAIIAYRDRTYGVPNTAARSDAYTGVGRYDLAPYNLSPSADGSVAINEVTQFGQNMLGATPFGFFPVLGGSVDRQTMTGIDGLRPTPGFGSLGELLVVRVDPELKTTDTPRWDRLAHLSIQQYGFDDKFSGLDDTTSSPTTIMSQIYDGDQTGTNMDDYAEKISMANSVLNTLSVRSDFFAVWFVVQGYQESDVANLRPEEPLIPSIHKRYLMVVDRTNVIEPGDKPKILVFKELPL